MKKILFLVLLMVFALQPLLADDASYSFTCEELYQLGRQEAPKWSKGWFRAGLCIALTSTVIGAGVGLENDPEGGLLLGYAVGAGIGVGLSIVLPLMMTPRSSIERYESAEANKCYTDGHLRKTRATNTGASLLGGILGGPIAPAGILGVLVVGGLASLLGQI